MMPKKQFSKWTLTICNPSLILGAEMSQAFYCYKRLQYCDLLR